MMRRHCEADKPY